MGMFDTVTHNGLEWQTKSIEPSLSGMMGDYLIKVLPHLYHDSPNLYTAERSSVVHHPSDFVIHSSF